MLSSLHEVIRFRR